MPFCIGKMQEFNDKREYIGFRPMSFSIGKILVNTVEPFLIGFRPMSFNIGKIPLHSNPILMTQTAEPIDKINQTSIRLDMAVANPV